MTQVERKADRKLIASRRLTLVLVLSDTSPQSPVWAERGNQFQAGDRNAGRCQVWVTEREEETTRDENQRSWESGVTVPEAEEWRFTYLLRVWPNLSGRNGLTLALYFPWSEKWAQCIKLGDKNQTNGLSRIELSFSLWYILTWQSFEAQCTGRMSWMMMTFCIFYFSRPDTYSPESKEGIIGSDLN